MRTLVVGGTGFLGRHIVGELLRRDHAVTVLARGHADLPTAVTVRQGDIRTIDQADLDALVAGHTGVVFAAGASARVPRGMAGPEYFRHANVEATERLTTAARAAGCDRAVVLSSYFATADREHPEWRLAATSPYIASRIAQARAAHAAAGADMAMAVLELPYVAGATPGRPSALGGMAKTARRWFGPVAFPGGTAVVSAAAVGRAVGCALDDRATGDFPLATGNFTWVDLMRQLAEAGGRTNVRVRRLSPRTTSLLCTVGGWAQRLRGIEYGFGPAQTSLLMCNDVFLDVTVGEKLGIGPDDLAAAFRETAQS